MDDCGFSTDNSRTLSCSAAGLLEDKIVSRYRELRSVEMRDRQSNARSPLIENTLNGNADISHKFILLIKPHTAAILILYSTC